jgi:hypothetical protein
LHLERKRTSLAEPKSRSLNVRGLQSARWSGTLTAVNKREPLFCGASKQASTQNKGTCFACISMKTEPGASDVPKRRPRACAWGSDCCGTCVSCVTCTLSILNGRGF